jgi:hypothetical protein
MIALLAELVVRFQFLERRAFFRSPKIIAQILVITVRPPALSLVVA